MKTASNLFWDIQNSEMALERKATELSEINNQLRETIEKTEETVTNKRRLFLKADSLSLTLYEDCLSLHKDVREAWSFKEDPSLLRIANKAHATLRIAALKGKETRNLLTFVNQNVAYTQDFKKRR